MLLATIFLYTFFAVRPGASSFNCSLLFATANMTPHPIYNIILLLKNVFSKCKLSRNQGKSPLGLFLQIVFLSITTSASIFFANQIKIVIWASYKVNYSC